MEEDIQNYYQMSCFVGHPVGQIRRQSAAARDMGRVPWLELKTGTSDRYLICIVQLLRFSGFSLYSLSFFLYSPFKKALSQGMEGLQVWF